MRTFASSTLAPLLGLAAAMLTGCGGAQSAAKSGALPPMSEKTVHHYREQSWVLPDASGKDLLYVAGSHDNTRVFVFTYPDGKHVGTLSGLWDPGTAMCVDASQNIWVSSANPGEMIEYPHGGSNPIATLTDEYGLPIGCSVDPTTGDLAVANIFGPSSKPYTSVIVYPNAQGNPTVYTVDNFEYLNGCAYDSSGNLFAIGWVYNSGTFMAELPAGGSQFQDLKVSKSIGAAGWLQWLGHYLYAGFVEAGSYGQIDQLSISGSKVTVKRKIVLNQANKGGIFFIDGQTVIEHVVPKYGTAGFWKFPSGGDPTKIIPNAPHEKGPIQNGIVVSKAATK
jgi:hypothetical protein